MLGLTLNASRATAQLAQSPTLTLRAGGAFHAAGLAMSSVPYPGQPDGPTLWQHRVRPTVAYGASLVLPLSSGLFGLRIDGDLVRRAGFEADPKGPPLERTATGRSHWIAGSAYVALTRLCATRCVRLSAGAGRGFYDYAMTELRGDIVNPLAIADHHTIARIGIDARLPFMGRRVSVHIADYIGRLTPWYDQVQRLSPMHTLIISGGVVLGR